MSFSHISVEPLTPTIGGIIHGVDLNAVKNPAVYEEIKQALWKHGVIFFRNQPIKPEAYLNLGRVFGEPEKHEFFPHVEGFPQIQKISHQGYSKPDTDRWHHDVSFRKSPTLVSILRANQLPQSGGDTMWMNCARAFEELGPGLQSLLLGVEAVHDLPWSFRKNDNYATIAEMNGVDRLEYELDMIRKSPEMAHPAIVNHPVTKKLTLYVNSIWTRKLRGIHPDLSDALLAMLFEWVKKPEFMCRFRWEQDSIAIWDNLATQHYAVFDYAPHYREMLRMTAGNFTPELDRATVPAEMVPASWHSSPSAQRALDSIVDKSRLAQSSPQERAAVGAIFEALDRVDLDALAARAKR
ncbi:TauD/TfdA dioxygenase family protein [Chachezhania sediminis]|uniref:TauD/TfdA dioxygenase family protein n=1 Tax=Chachezhania sediminis TaxID=2599291 RepID=UPI00131B1A2B|nr:TauD/TfdA family dioxygenase [Chachezhania sediminis]